MALFNIAWSINVDAETPEDAVRQALELHKDLDGSEPHLQVIEDTTGVKHFVDLSLVKAT